MEPPLGCAFHTRCSLFERSRPDSEEREPKLREVGPAVACHLAGPDRVMPRLVETAGRASEGRTA